MRQRLNRQSQQLFRKTFVRMLVALVVYTAAFAVLALWANLSVFPSIAEGIAESAHWTEVSQERYRQINAMGQSTTLDAWPTTDGRYMARDLSDYRRFQQLKMPAVSVAYTLGAVVLLFVTLRRSFSYFDELSNGVTSLLGDPERQIELSDDLSLTQGDLLRIQRRALSDAKAAKMAEQRKDELVAYIAHDIRTPLTTILGYLDILRSTPDLPSDARGRCAQISYDSATRLNDLLDEFFEVTRYNLQSIPLKREDTDVALLCRQVEEELHPDSQARGVAIAHGGPDELVWFIDPEKFARVLSNVLRNAIAFASPGTTVNVDARAKEGGLVVCVTDCGREISAEHLELIFEKFYREDGARPAERGRAGLGLAIAKELVVAHDGDIRAASKLGETTFTIRIPGARVASAHAISENGT